MATHGFSGHFDVISAIITVAAFIALFRFNITCYMSFYISTDWYLYKNDMSPLT